MTLWSAIGQAIKGWYAILRRQAGWEHHFNPTLPGLVTALVFFYLFAFLAVVSASLQVGVPTLGGLLDIMLVQSLWLIALTLALLGTRFAVADKAPLLPVLVPGIYALTGYLILGALISLIFGLLLPLLWLALVYALFQLGRAAGHWTIGVSAAFAVLAVVLLVGLPMTLYMLSAPAISA